MDEQNFQQLPKIDETPKDAKIETADNLIEEKSMDKVETKKEENLVQEKWERTKNEIETTVDMEGHGIDEGIKDPVIALNAFEINTGQSCEGHIDGGMSAPWIRIEAPNEPEERFVGQNDAFKIVAKKYNMPVEEAKRMFNADAYLEAMHECQINRETNEFKKYKEESGKLLYIAKEILNDFYKNHQVPDSLRIKVDVETADDMLGGSFEIFNGGEDYRNINDETLSRDEKEALSERLKGYRGEMKAFADFLKDKFFSEGEIYINAKRKTAQEKIDQNKIEELRNKINKDKTPESEAEDYLEENLKNFEQVEIKKLSELPYWNKIEKFITDKKIANREVILAGDEKKWKSLYGSNDSKSSSEPKVIILKKEIFDRENISDENISWLIHEIGHVEFYKSLGERLDKYMKEYYQKGEYTDSDMEKSAFQLQFEYLKSVGKTKEECANFIKGYLDKSFKENEQTEKEKESTEIMKYIDEVY